MFKNLKLGVKLNGSFIAVSALTLILGALAIFSMLKVKTSANVLALEKVPAVALANEVERDSLKTMYQTRGYAFTEETQFLDKAREDLAAVKKDIKAAADHAAKFELKVLAANAKLADEKASEYERLLNETVKATEAMAKDKAEMNTSAAEYMKACADFLEGQSKQLESDIDLALAEKLTEEKLKERIKKTVLCNDVIDLGNSVRIGAWKAIATRDPVLFKDTMKRFSEINGKLDELKAITRQEVNLRQIADCRKAGGDYQKGMEASSPIGLLAKNSARSAASPATKCSRPRRTPRCST